jgi:hypothetical protein
MKKNKENAAARAALLEAAKDARERGDIGKEGGPEAWTWLEYWADRKFPEKG